VITYHENIFFTVLFCIVCNIKKLSVMNIILCMYIQRVHPPVNGAKTPKLLAISSNNQSGNNRFKKCGQTRHFANGRSSRVQCIVGCKCALFGKCIVNAYGIQSMPTENAHTVHSLHIAYWKKRYSMHTQSPLCCLLLVVHMMLKTHIKLRLGFIGRLKCM